MGRVICKWCIDYKIIMILEENDGIFTVDGKAVTPEVASKVCTYNYQNAIKYLKENEHG